jgi:DNA replication and repair protein RecF
MHVQRISLEHFRNHRTTTIDLGAGVNVLLGNNGQGKTNILEALSFIGLTKSFFGATDRVVMQFGAESFQINAIIWEDRGTENAVRVAYDDRTGEKRFLVNGVEPERRSAVIGRFPFVVLSPEHDAITSGSPGERRRWVDILLSQVSAMYLEELLEYRRALQQRNRILLGARLEQRPAGDVIEPWTEALIRHGAVVLQRRREFVRTFRDRFAAEYVRLVGGTEHAGIDYRCGIDNDGDGTIEGEAAAFRAALERRRGDEIRRGSTLAGPHRDDLAFTLEGVRLQDYGSQGQHKTCLVALKFAERDFLADQRDETPQFLLDDLFSELDAERSARILDRLGRMGQCVVTTTDAGAFTTSPFPVSRYHVEAGTCRQD